MKRLFCLLFAVSLLLPSILFVSAADAVSFTLGEAECGVGHLAEIEMQATCGKKLSAALFTFTYDTNVLSFRKAESPKGSKLVCNETQDGMKLSYLCASGAETGNGAAVFTLQFKAEATGSADIGFNVSDCVDSSAQPMEIGQCASGRITVTQKAEAGNDNASPDRQSAQDGQSRQNKDSILSEKTGRPIKSKSESTTGKQSSTRETTEPATTVLGTNEAMQRDYNNVIPIVVLCLSGTTAAAFFGFLAYKLISSVREKKKTEEPPHNDE